MNNETILLSIPLKLNNLAPAASSARSLTITRAYSIPHNLPNFTLTRNAFQVITALWKFLRKKVAASKRCSFQ